MCTRVSKRSYSHSMSCRCNLCMHLLSTAHTAFDAHNRRSGLVSHILHVICTGVGWVWLVRLVSRVLTSSAFVMQIRKDPENKAKVICFIIFKGLQTVSFLLRPQHHPMQPSLLPIQASQVIREIGADPRVLFLQLPSNEVLALPSYQLLRPHK